ncbi:tyrosine-protein kinase Etk/Wzc [Pedobacter sp. CG_S7]|uniref:GumC family protein n=1 Tax=Pedobacter sp. CG_S7 TaxID=3143930 RepID=UPI00339485BE
MAINKQFQGKKPDMQLQIMKYVRYWYFFAIAILLGIGGAYFYLKITVPLYKITSTLLIQDDSKGDGILKGTAFSDLNMFRTSRTVDNEIEVLRSRDLIYKVLVGMSFETSYSNKLPLKKQELYGNTLPIKVIVKKLTDQAYHKEIAIKIINDNQYILTDDDKKFTYQFNQTINRPAYEIQVFKGPAFSIINKPVYVQFNDLHQLAESYSTNKLNILPTIKEANTIMISLLDEIPQRGVDLLSLLIETYNQENVSNKNLMAVNTIKFIDGKLKFLSKDLNGVEQDVEIYKKNNRVTELGADAQMNLESSGSYNQQLESSTVQLSLVQSIISYLNTTEDQFDLVPTTLGLKDPVLNSLTDKYNNLQIERQRLLRTNRKDNPLITNITEQLVGLKFNLLENLKMIKNGLILEKNNFSDRSSLFEARLRSVPAIERGLLEKSREQGVKTTLYHYLLQKREETELSLSSTIPTSQIIDKPAYKSIPDKPKVQLVYLLGIIFGFLAPASVIYSRDKLNSKVRDLLDVEYITGTARVLGELTHKEIGESIVVHKDKSTTISELFKYIRSNLNFLQANNNTQVLLITSSMKGEGKTFFSVNLGITLSLVSKKVVILEFDLRKPDLLNSMKLTSKIGLTEYLTTENLTVNDILIPSSTSENLSVIGCGSIPENPSELLMSEKINVLFHELKKRFDYIILDTPPVGQVADAFSLAPFADASIYLVRYNFTEKSELGIFEEICENKRLKNPMLVFNDAKKENKNVYRYGRYSYSS